MNGGNACVGPATRRQIAAESGKVRPRPEKLRAVPFCGLKEPSRMDFTNFLDARSAVIVFGGTLIATLLRCGLADCRQALAAIATLGRRGFDGDKVRAELAVQVQEIETDGILRVKPHEVGDTEFDDDEFIESVRVPLSKLVTLTLEGKIRDGKTQIAALRAQMMIDRGIID
jgi:hypothetical protein